MTDFWQSSGWHLMERDADGHMVPGDAYMAAYFARPELAIVEESCEAEIALGEKLREAPFAAVEETELTAIRDADARENFRAVLRFRDYLARYPTLEAAYLAAARGAGITFPPLFMEQMAHAILRNILDGETSPMKLRAAEILFRDQKVTIEEERIMLADSNVVELSVQYRNLTGGGGSNPDDRNVQIDIMTADNAEIYWQRNDLYNMSVNIGFNQPALNSLCRVMEDWVRHFLKTAITITPQVKIEDDDWRWHLGLDAESSAILNDIYNQAEVGEERLARILSLFKITASGGMAEGYDGTPIYMGLAMNSAGVVRAKPQNLLVNLPIAGFSS